jgi:hypothetical protein
VDGYDLAAHVRERSVAHFRCNVSIPVTPLFEM